MDYLLQGDAIMSKITLFYERVKNSSLRQNLKDSIRDIWTHSSTSIEGNTLSLGDTAFVLSEGLTISGKTVREHNEIIGHSHAIDIIYNLVSDSKNAIITNEKLFELHKAVMLNPVMDIYAPIGKFKVESNFTRKVDSKSGKIVYKEYPIPELIPELIEKWKKLFINNGTDEVLMQYCKLHILFSAIHPFADGNGRMSRLLANIPIIKSGFVPVTISKESRKEYIELLQNTEVDFKELIITNGLDKFINFIKKEWKVSLELYEEVLGRD